MSEQSSFVDEASPPKPATAINPLKLLSLLLLLPAVFLCAAMQVYPALDTFVTSRTDGNPLSDAENVGFENYDRLFEDARLERALGYTLRLSFARVMIAATIPLLVGLLVGMQPRLPRLLNRILLSVVVVVLSPAILAMVWYFFFGRTWDFDTFNPSPFDPLPDYLALNTVNGARNNLQLLDIAITTGMAIGLGSLAFMAVARGRKLSKEPMMAGAAAWFVGVLVAIVSFTQTFDLPYLLTRGGPIDSTSTLSLHGFLTGFQMFRFGYAAALASIEIVIIAVIATTIWAVITGLDMRLHLLPNKDESSEGGVLSVISLPIIFLLGLPVVGLMLWGLWLVLSNGGFSPAFEDTDWGQLLGNSLSGPWLGIWVIQLPLAYLVGLTLGFFRPLGRIGSSILFLPFVVFAMMPVSAMEFAWFDMTREAELLNTPTATALPWLFGGLSFIVMKMFFDGAHDTYEESVAGGQSSGNAFTSQVLLPSLPLALTVGVALSLFAASDLLWPLIVLNDPDNFTVTIHIMQLLGRFAPGTALIGSVVFYGGLISLIFLPVVALLNIFVLDRLALVAGPTVAAEDATPTEAEAPTTEDEDEAAEDEPEDEAAD